MKINWIEYEWDIRDDKEDPFLIEIEIVINPVPSSLFILSLKL